MKKRRAPVYLLLDGADYTYTDYQGSIEPLLFVFVERRLREFYKRADKTRSLTDPVKRDHAFWELNNDYRKLKELVNEIIRLDDAWEDFRNRRKTWMVYSSAQLGADVRQNHIARMTKNIGSVPNLLLKLP
jgi:hypothetical protein